MSSLPRPPRYTSYRHEPVARNDHGDPLCRYCRGVVIPPRRTICSKECVHEIRMRTSNQYARAFIYHRDRGVCSVCDVDTKKIRDEYFQSSDPPAVLRKYSIPASRKVWKRKLGGGLFDVDHIVDVQHGGGSCGAENLRTLCISCHKKKTYTK